MLINNKYIIETELGEGSFGKLYKGRHVYTNKLVAIKLHKVDGETMIRNEARILKLLINTSGVPIIKAFGKQDGIFYMVVDLLGESVERLNKNADVDLILRTMRRLVTILNVIHDIGVIHRDIKPDNVLFTDKKDICLIDFGLSTMFIDSDGNHIKQLSNRDMVGNIIYVSNNIHSGSNPSRRDDLISVLYMTIKLIIGELPWSSYNIDNVAAVKRDVNLSNYFNDKIPNGMYDLYTYCNSLGFKERPNYDYICKELIV
tara:strand:+ start:265 stop:1041 length:777 start_codon:yes stop_codon:yes gene_type:complete